MPRPLRVALLSAVATLLLSSCGSAANGSNHPVAASGTSLAQSIAVARKPPAPFRWRTVAPHISVATTDHGYVSFMWMDPTKLKFRFIPGTMWPEKSPRTAADRNPGSWIPTMMAAFNGAFKLQDGVGGYYYRGREVAALRDGLASLVTYKDGSLRVGAWGRDLHMTPSVVAVRQNLKPIIDGGVSQVSKADTPKTWGITIHRTPYANRTLLGVLKDGSFIFEFAHRATPTMLANEAVHAGVQFAIALDMNGIWPTGYVYTHNTKHLYGVKINGIIERMPKLYMTTNNKDFIAVQSPTPIVPGNGMPVPTYPGAKVYTLR
ncbi:MAG: hypothetical protein ACYC3W_03965 [Candidatus Nanopelagicales bacterium]